MRLLLLVIFLNSKTFNRNSASLSWEFLRKLQEIDELSSIIRKERKDLGTKGSNEYNVTS